MNNDDQHILTNQLDSIRKNIKKCLKNRLSVFSISQRRKLSQLAATGFNSIHENRLALNLVRTYADLLQLIGHLDNKAKYYYLQAINIYSNHDEENIVPIYNSLAILSCQ